MSGPILNGLISQLVFTTYHGGGKSPYQFHGNIAIIKIILTKGSHLDPALSPYSFL